MRTVAAGGCAASGWAACDCLDVDTMLTWRGYDGIGNSGGRVRLCQQRWMGSGRALALDVVKNSLCQSKLLIPTLISTG